MKTEEERGRGREQSREGGREREMEGEKEGDLPFTKPLLNFDTDLFERW